MITVYSKPACPQCTATKRYLDKAGVAYEVKDVTEDETALAAVKALGYEAVPVVYVDENTHWSNLHIERIQALAS